MSFAIIVGQWIVIFLFGFAASLLWYCFDDQLAFMAGNPAIGDVGYGTMLAFTWFVTYLFKTNIGTTLKERA